VRPFPDQNDARDRQKPRMYMRGTFACLVALVLIGCDRAAPTAAVARPTVQPGPGIVTGVVRFTGPRPTVAAVEGECCPGVPRPADESIVVNDDGTLRNVVVYIKDGPNVATSQPTTALLTQQGCRYIPHVLALRTGQKLVVTSHDPTLHNVLVRPTSPGNPSANLPEYQNGSLSFTFDQPDDEVSFACSVHAWMKAYAMVFDHPCYAVTGDGGTFRIEHLPPGTYTLIAHHEQLGDLQQSVTVSADKPTADVRIEYHPQ
jgi:plastocyanin